MFHCENSTIGPNPLTASTEDEETRYRGRDRLLRDMGNQQVQRRRSKGVPGKLTWNCTLEQDEEEGVKEGKEKMVKQHILKRPNVIMQFSSSDDEEEMEEEKQQVQKHQKCQKVPDQPTRETAHPNRLLTETPSSIMSQIPKRNNLLLSFSEDEENSQDDTEAVASSEPQPLQFDKNKLILNFESDEEETPSQQNILQKLNKNVLSSLLSRSKDKFYLQPIEEGETLQCLIKRERNGSQIKYQIHDSATLRNIMTVVKAEEGYLLISKYNELSDCLPTGKGDTVVGKLLSNFFGTEFNCYLWTYPFKKFTEYTVDPDKTRQVITIEYQTNIFGLKGPRKMSAYIPSVVQGVVSKKRLNQIYQHEHKKKLPATVWKFNNKTPKWNPSIEAYVLNFHGRATVSSIKNFIMVSEDENNDADPRVLFGKFGKDLFNLDVGHPFSLIQGVALALSSFDKKLACE